MTADGELVIMARRQFSIELFGSFIPFGRSPEKTNTSQENRKNRSWKPITEAAIRRIVELNAQRIKPTLRTIYYFLGSICIGFRLNNSDYGYLSGQIVEARLDHRLDWYAIADNVRETLNIPEEFEAPETYLQHGIDFMKSAEENFTLPLWHNQKHYIEFWIEKDAMAGTVLSVVREWQIAVAVCKGNDSWTHFKESCDRIVEKLQEGKTVHIYYLGDYDPSGRKMFMELRERFKKLNVSLEVNNIEFTRLGITEDQILTLRLPKINDDDTLKKLNRDKNSKEFLEENGGELFQVELDALPAYDPVYFKNLLLAPITKYFDKRVYEQTLRDEKAGQERISTLVRKMSFGEAA